MISASGPRFSKRAAFSATSTAASLVARLQIQHISVLRTGIEQALFGRKIPRIMMMMMVVTMMMMVVVVVSPLAERARTVDGGELAADIATVIQVAVAPLVGATVTTTAEATAAQAGSTEDTAGETATVL